MKYPNVLTILLLAWALLSCGNNLSELQLAAARGQSDYIKALIAQGADINEPNKHGTTPLILAADNGHLEVVKLFIAQKANVNAKDNDQMTALMAAASDGHSEIVKVLMEANANPNITNKFGSTALANAVFFGHDEATKTLLSTGTKTNSEIGDKTLLIAAGLGNTPIVKTLLNAGFNIDARGKKGRTPIMVAIAFEHPETVQFLIDNKADLTVKDDEGATLMELAESENNSAIINALKKANAS